MTDPIICKDCGSEVRVVDARRPKYLCPNCGPLWNFHDVVGGTKNSPRGNYRARRVCLTTIVIRVEKCKLNVPVSVPMLFRIIQSLEKMLARPPSTGEIYEIFAANTDDRKGMSMRGVRINLNRMAELGLLNMEIVSHGRKGRTTEWSIAGELLEWWKNGLKIANGIWDIVPKVGSSRGELPDGAWGDGGKVAGKAVVPLKDDVAPVKAEKGGK